MDAGVLPSDVVLTFGCATDEPATRLLRVDARGDRLVEADARGRTVRTVDVADVVSFEARAKDDDEDRWDFVDEYARWLDEDDVREWRNTVIVNVASASGRHRKRDDDDDDGVERGEGTAVVTVEYRMRCENDSRALGHAMRRLSRGRWNPALDDDRLPESLASLDARIVTSGVLLLRNRPRTRPGAPERAVRCGGGWSKRLAVITAGGRLFLMEQCDAGDASATAVYGANVRVTDAVSLDESAVVTVRRGAAPGEFDVVTGDGRARLALAALDSDPRGAEGWIDALREGAGVAGPRGNVPGDVRGKAGEADGRTGASFGDENEHAGAAPGRPRRWAGLDAETRAALADATRTAIALNRAPRTRGQPESDGVRHPRGGSGGGGDVLVLDRYWRSVELGLTAHFLFSFTVDAVRGPSGGETRSAVTLRVNVEGCAIEGYAARRCRSTGELRQTLVRSLDATDAATTPPEGPRGRVVRLVSRGLRSTPAGTELGRFEFQSAADAGVFESLLRDVRSGAYQSAERYQARTVLKRGSEDAGVSSPPPPVSSSGDGATTTTTTASSSEVPGPRSREVARDGVELGSGAGRGGEPRGPVERSSLRVVVVVVVVREPIPRDARGFRGIQAVLVRHGVARRC